MTNEPSTSDQARCAHACLPYRSDDERGVITREWMQRGLDAGRRGIYIRHDSESELLADLGSSFNDALSEGALSVAASASVYDMSRHIDPGEQLTIYTGVLAQAVADGFRGLQVVADITTLVDDVGRRPSHLHWEQVADRYMSKQPVAPLCMYDARVVAGIDAIVAVHNVREPDATSFSFSAIAPTRVALAGDLDACSADTLAATLAAMPSTDDCIDLRDLTFIDGHCASLVEHELRRRRRHGQHITLVNASPAVRRVWNMCGLDTALLVEGAG